MNVNEVSKISQTSEHEAPHAIAHLRSVQKICFLTVSLLIFKFKKCYSVRLHHTEVVFIQTGLVVQTLKTAPLILLYSGSKKKTTLLYLCPPSLTAVMEFVSLFKDPDYLSQLWLPSALYLVPFFFFYVFKRTKRKRALKREPAHAAINSLLLKPTRP